jgi:peptidoglycan/xylan/chitin deacetylase (PgdA/CDA1 family)
VWPMRADDGGGAGPTRRVLLTAAGLTLLGACAAELAPETVSQETPAAPRPNTRPGAGRAQAGNPGHATHGSTTRAHLDRADRRPRQGPPARHGRKASGEAPMRFVDDGPKAIALTIDDGPDPVYTPQVLRLLDRYGVTATFSMIGVEVQAHPGVAREVVAAGHLIANHTWSHRNLTWLGPAGVTDQMNRATGEIHAVTGTLPALFRAPYGAWSQFVLQQCAQTAMIPLGWSVDPRDWSRPGVASIISNIMRNTRTGSIILEHDGGGNRAQTVAALGQVLPRLLAAGYHFVTP